MILFVPGIKIGYFGRCRFTPKLTVYLKIRFSVASTSKKGMPFGHASHFV